MNTQSLLVALVISMVGTVATAVDAADQTNPSGFSLTSTEVANGGALPKEFTGDGASATLPLEWAGAPAGTKSYALIMHHIPGPGDVKWYWILYNIPAEIHSLPKSVQGIGTLGNNSVNRRTGYAPPHSKGPGAKIYVLTLYALSAAPQLNVPPAQVNRATLLDAIKDLTLASAELKVTYDRTSIVAAGGSEGAPGGAERAPVGGEPRGDLHLMRREVEELNLTSEQRKQLDDLTREAKEKLEKILTAGQVKILEESRPPRPSN